MPLRHDLALPNELLHKVILWVLCDSVHDICTSPADSTWATHIVAVLHQVSPAFRAISSELAAKAFDISRDVRNDHAALRRAVHEKLAYLASLGATFRDPAECRSVSLKTIDCSASSFVFAYALYLSCSPLRRNAICSQQRDAFETTHTVIFSTLAHSESLCARVKPAEVTWALRRSLQIERNLAVLGLNLVQGFTDLHSFGNALALFQIHVEKDGTGPVSGARGLMHIALSKVEGAYASYQDILTKIPSSEPQVYELPGVVRGLERLATLTIDQDQYDLRNRIRKVVEEYGLGPAENKNH